MVWTQISTISLSSMALSQYTIQLWPHSMRLAISVASAACTVNAFVPFPPGKEKDLDMTVSLSVPTQQRRECGAWMWPVSTFSFPSNITTSYTHVLSYSGIPAAVMNQMKIQECR